MKVLAKTHFPTPIVLGNGHTIRWTQGATGFKAYGGKELKGLRSVEPVVLAEHKNLSRHEFNTMLIAQLNRTEARELGLKTALGVIEGTEPGRDK